MSKSIPQIQPRAPLAPRQPSTNHLDYRSQRPAPHIRASSPPLPFITKRPESANKVTLPSIASSEPDYPLLPSASISISSYSHSLSASSSNLGRVDTNSLHAQVVELRRQLDQREKEKQVLQAQCLKTMRERDEARWRVHNLVAEDGRKRKTSPSIAHDDDLASTHSRSSSACSKRRRGSPSSPSDDSRPASPITVTLPPLKVEHVLAMYQEKGGRMFCKTCLELCVNGSTRSANVVSFPTSQAGKSSLFLDDLVKHCAFEHPQVYAGTAGLSMAQVWELRERLKTI